MTNDGRLAEASESEQEFMEMDIYRQGMVGQPMSILIWMSHFEGYSKVGLLAG